MNHELVACARQLQTELSVYFDLSMHDKDAAKLAAHRLTSAMERYPLPIVDYTCRIAEKNGHDHETKVRLFSEILSDLDGCEYISNVYAVAQTLWRAVEARTSLHCIPPSSSSPTVDAFLAMLRTSGDATRKQKRPTTRGTSRGKRTDATDGAPSVCVLVDSRERDQSFLPLTCMTKHAKPRFVHQQLPIGDFLFAYYDAAPCDSGTETIACVDQFTVCGIIIERKTVQDLSSSILDGRFQSQRVRLQFCGLPTVIYVIEGKLTSTFSLSRKVLQSAIFSLQVNDGFLVIHTGSPSDTAQLLERIAVSIEEDDAWKALCRPRAEFQRPCARGLGFVYPRTRKPPLHVSHPQPCLSGARYASWVEHTLKRTLEWTNDSGFYHELCSIPSVTSCTAALLVSRYSSLSELTELLYRIEKTKGALLAEFYLTTLNWDDCLTTHEALHTGLSQSGEEDWLTQKYLHTCETEKGKRGKMKNSHGAIGTSKKRKTGISDAASSSIYHLVRASFPIP